MEVKTNPDYLASIHGVSPIGSNQRTIAFTVVADATGGFVNITAAGHSLKKHECVTIVGGAYAGVHRINKIVSSSIIQIPFVFAGTAAGNLLLMGQLDGFGFYCDEVPLTIAEFVPENPKTDALAIIATEFIAGCWYPYPFKKIRITAGNATCVRKPVPAVLTYTNR